MITISKIQFVKVDNKAVRDVVRNLLIKSNGDVRNGQVITAFRALHDDMQLEDWQHIDPTQIQDAFSYFRFSPQQAKFRARIMQK